VREELAFYAEPGLMTTIAGPEVAIGAVPADARGIAAVVQGVVVHPFWASAYDVEVTSRGEDDLQTRSASIMVERILEIDARPLTEPRAPRDRFVGNCRHFSTLTVAFLRHAGVPSRARCGFASYFEPSKWVDHWVVEYWDGDRWVTLDAQLDALQRTATGLAADPTDLPPGLFLPAGAAWLRCQAGELDGDRFGILDLWGQWFIRGNVARDLAALNKVEMLPWDGWGDLAGMGASPGGAYVDEIAALTVSDDHAEIRHRYETDARVRVPSRVTNYYASPPAEVVVPELA
jgi:Transglutaminase-like superfamily